LEELFKTWKDGNKAWFVLHNGEIAVKNPDVESRNKMIVVATSLESKSAGTRRGILQGDRGCSAKGMVENMVV
jgi:hypothetical protein